MTNRFRLWLVMIACFALGAVLATAAQYFSPITVAALGAVVGFWAMYGLSKVLEKG